MATLQGQRERHTKGQQQWANLNRQQTPIKGKSCKVSRGDLGITGRAEPAFIVRQLLSMNSRLQTLLMVAPVARPITQHNVIILHQQQHRLRGVNTVISFCFFSQQHILLYLLPGLVSTTTTGGQKFLLHFSTGRETRPILLTAVFGTFRETDADKRVKALQLGAGLFS